VKIAIVFPGRSLETAKRTGSVMPVAPTLLAALTPVEHEVSLVDTFFDDQVDYESDVDVVAISVRTPLAVSELSRASGLKSKDFSSSAGTKILWKLTAEPWTFGTYEQTPRPFRH